LEYSSEDDEFYLIRLDVDRFSVFNYYYGIEEGNKVLKFIANKLKDMLKDYSINFGRCSGDVFGILLKGKKEELLKFVDDISIGLKSYSDSFDIIPTFGVYKVVDKTMEFQQMFDKALIAAKTIKSQYEKKYALYDPSMSDKVLNEQKIINEMNSALASHEFVIYLQPKVEIESGNIVGAEALVRWIKNGHVIPPNDFIPVFERNGFISRLDIYVWEETLKYLADRIKNKKPLFPISVNVSRVHFYSSNIVNTIVSLADKYNVPHVYLELEVTESLFMEDIDSIKRAISELRKAGFKVLIDDFGSGYSSLNVLKDIEFDVLKIDFKFLSKEGEYERGKKIIDSVVKLSRSLEITAIAEGVETAEQSNLLRNIGCNYAQGYYYSRPISVPSFDELIENSSLGEEEMPKQVVLIADDEKPSRKILRKVLESEYDILEAEDGVEAMKLLKEHNVDILLLDLYMPNMTGMEVLSKKNKITELINIPTIVISSSSDREEKFKMIALGANDFINKPFDVDILKNKIREFL